MLDQLKLLRWKLSSRQALQAGKLVCRNRMQYPVFSIWILARRSPVYAALHGVSVRCTMHHAWCSSHFIFYEMASFEAAFRGQAEQSMLALIAIWLHAIAYSTCHMHGKNVQAILPQIITTSCRHWNQLLYSPSCIN